MSKLVITIPGMGKTTYVKQKFSGLPHEQRRVVDFDYKCPYKSFTKEQRYANTKAMTQWLLDGVADVVLVNVDWVSPGAINNERIEVIFIHPQDVESVKQRLIERDGDDETVRDAIDAYAEQLMTMERTFGKRFKSRSYTMETLEKLDEVLNESDPNSETGDQADETQHDVGDDNVERAEEEIVGEDDVTNASENTPEAGAEEQSTVEDDPSQIESEVTEEAEQGSDNDENKKKESDDDDT